MLLRAFLFFLFCHLCLGRVDDQAKLLQPTTTVQVESSIADIHQKYGYDVIVLTMPADKVDNNNARSVARDYAGDRMSGIFFLLTSKSLWLFTSRSLEPIFTSAVKQRIWRNMGEFLKQGQFDTGVLLGVSEVQHELGQLISRPRPTQDKLDFSFLWVLLISGLLLYFVCNCAAASYKNKGPVYGVPLSGNPPAYNPAYNPGVGSGWGSGGGGGWMSSMFGALGGVFLGNMLYDSVFSHHHHRYSGSDGYDMQNTYSNPMHYNDQMDYAGGFGGDFGGGDFGGGDFGGGDF